MSTAGAHDCILPIISYFATHIFDLFGVDRFGHVNREDSRDKRDSFTAYWLGQWMVM